MGVMDLFNLGGKVVLVTGAGSGLGQGFAEALGEAGAAVACADVNDVTAQETAEKIRALGRKAIAIHVDVAEEASVGQMVEETVRQLGTLDVIFCNAGIGGGRGAQAHEIPIETWHRIMAINLTGVFLCVREAAKVMIPQQRGKMILTASIYGQVGSFNGESPAYTAAKGGVVNLTKELAIEYAPHGITLNAIAPVFLTPISCWRRATRPRRRKSAMNASKRAFRWGVSAQRPICKAPLSTWLQRRQIT